MLVAIDIGNSKIKVGFFEDLNQTVSKVSFFDTNIKSITDISNSINKYIDSLNKDINLAGCIISSVVPNLNKEISLEINKKLNLSPIFVDSNLITEINFNYEPVSDLGSDRIADCVAVNNLYPKNYDKIGGKY